MPHLPLLIGVDIDQATQIDIGRSLRGSKSSDADVHLTVAQWEDPAVSRQDFVRLAAQFQMTRDPRIISAIRVDIPASGYSVGGFAMPLAPEHTTQLRSHTIGHHELTTPHFMGASLRTRTAAEDDASNSVTLAHHVDGPCVLKRDGPGIEGHRANHGIEFTSGGCATAIG